MHIRLIKSDYFQHLPTTALVVFVTWGWRVAVTITSMIRCCFNMFPLCFLLLSKPLRTAKVIESLQECRSFGIFNCGHLATQRSCTTWPCNKNKIRDITANAHVASPWKRHLRSSNDNCQDREAWMDCLGPVQDHFVGGSAYRAESKYHAIICH